MVTMFQFELHMGLGDSFETVLGSVQEHVQTYHGVEEGNPDFNNLVTRHMAAVIRLPSDYTYDDGLLPNELGLPPLRYDDGLHPGSE